MAGVGVEEGEEIAAGRRIDHLVDPGQRKGILGASLVEVSVIDAHPPLLVLPLHHYWVG